MTNLILQSGYAWDGRKYQVTVASLDTFERRATAFHFMRVDTDEHGTQIRVYLETFVTLPKAICAYEKAIA